MRIRLTDRDRLCLLCYVKPGSAGWRALTLGVISESRDGTASDLFLWCDDGTARELKNLARLYCPAACLAIERPSAESSACLAPRAFRDL